MSQLSAKRLLRTVIALSCVGSLSACAQEQQAEKALARADFARGISLVPKESRAIHTVLLPRSVYRGLARPNLADLRVYNRAGVEVPHAVRPLPLASSHVTRSASLPIFPLRAAPGASDPRSGLAIHATRDSAGAIVDIRLTEAHVTAEKADSPGTEALPVVGYLVDASQWQEPMDALEIVVGQAGGDYVLSVSIETSDDLSNFQAVGSAQSLAHLEYNGQRIERSRLDLSGLRARYLRLSWDAASAPTFQEVRVEVGSDVTASPREPERIHGTWEQVGKVASYDLGGALPIERLRALLEEDNTLVRATVESARSKAGPFEPLHEGVFYRVRHAGALLESEAAPVRSVEARYLRFENLGPGGGAGSKPPDLEIDHHPDQLLYAERGEGPFELVFGHHAARPSAFSAGDLLSMLPDAARLSLPDSDTTLGSVQDLAGPSALVAPPPPPPLRKYALWAVLVLAVVVLAAAAVRLARGERSPS